MTLKKGACTSCTRISLTPDKDGDDPNARLGSTYLEGAARDGRLPTEVELCGEVGSHKQQHKEIEDLKQPSYLALSVAMSEYTLPPCLYVVGTNSPGFESCVVHV